MNVRFVSDPVRGRHSLRPGNIECRKQEPANDDGSFEFLTRIGPARRIVGAHSPATETAAWM
jgi:hypothetical protein